MSDPHSPDPYDRTHRLDGTDAPSPAEAGTRRMPAAAADPTRPLAPQERTQMMPGAAGAPAQPIAYTEDYAAGDTHARNTYASDTDRGGAVPIARPAGRTPSSPEDARRTFTPMTLALSIIAALLVGAILTLLLLPEEEPQIVLEDQQAAVALTEAQTANAAQAARIVELEAQAAGLTAQVAERDQTVADLQQQLAAGGDQAAADQAAADQAAADEQAALDARDQALSDREVAIDTREAQVAEREATVAAAEQQGDTSAGGFELPDVGDLEIPTDLPGELPQIDEDQARGLVERFIDRISSFFG